MFVRLLKDEFGLNKSIRSGIQIFCLEPGLHGFEDYRIKYNWCVTSTMIDLYL